MSAFSRHPREGGDPVSFDPQRASQKAKSLDYRPLLRPALRAIGFADVRSGILPPQSRLRENDGLKISGL